MKKQVNQQIKKKNINEKMVYVNIENVYSTNLHANRQYYLSMSPIHVITLNHRPMDLSSYRNTFKKHIR